MHKKKKKKKKNTNTRQNILSYTTKSLHLNKVFCFGFQGSFENDTENV